MSEDSRFWDGTITGDAIEAPYGAGTSFSNVMSLVSGADLYSNSDRGGVLVGVLNGLSPAASSNTVTVDTGRAMCYGTWYENNTLLSIVLPVPVSSTRIDRLVIRKSWGLQTARITRIAGVEGGGVPAVVQSVGVTWDTKMYQCSITTGGAVTFTDERSCIGPRPGDFKFSAVAPTDAGWVKCPTGQAIARASFVALNFLMSQDGYLHGNGNGTTTFNLPNIVGRAIVPVDAGSSHLTGFTTVATAIGEQLHTLSAAESGVPAHTHGVLSTTGGNPNGNLSLYGTNGVGNYTWPTDGGSPAAASNGHNTVQPTIAENVFIFVGAG